MTEISFENEIIRSVLDGDMQAFETIVRSYEKQVYNLALRMVGNPEDAADMAQETFIKAYKALGSFRNDSKFSVWLYRIATNVCIDFLRRNRHGKSVSLTADDDEDTQLDIPDLSADPEELLSRKMTADAVRRGLETLCEQHRSVLILREINGLSYEEIAQTLDIDIGTVKSRIFRARKRLCAFLTEDGNIPEKYASNKEKGGTRR